MGMLVRTLPVYRKIDETQSGIDCLQYAMREYGFQLAILSDDAFQRHWNAELKNPAASDTVGGRSAYMSNNARGIRYMPDAKCDFTTQAPYRLGFKWPIADSGYVRRMIHALDGWGMFDTGGK